MTYMGTPSLNLPSFTLALLRFVLHVHLEYMHKDQDSIVPTERRFSMISSPEHTLFKLTTDALPLWRPRGILFLQLPSFTLVCVLCVFSARSSGISRARFYGADRASSLRSEHPSAHIFKAYDMSFTFNLWRFRGAPLCGAPEKYHLYICRASRQLAFFGFSLHQEFQEQDSLVPTERRPCVVGSPVRTHLNLTTYTLPLWRFRGVPSLHSASFTLPLFELYLHVHHQFKEQDSCRLCVVFTHLQSNAHILNFLTDALPVNL